MKLTTLFIIASFLLAPNFAQSKDLCPPDYSQAKITSNNQSQNENSDENPVFVYFDGSLSMKGYVVDQPGQNNLFVSVIDDLQQIAENVGSKTFYHRFGNKVVPIPDNQTAKVIKPSFYDCKGSKEECDNQFTALQLPFKAAKANPDGTYIIVTDLFLENKQLVGKTLNTLTKPLKSILKKGQSIGVFGIMSSFNGKIWGIPTKEGPTMSYSEAQKRPFYIIVIGNQKHINKIKKNLEEQHFVDGDEKYKFALITSSPVLPKQSQKKLINKDSLGKLAKAEKFKFQYLEDNLPVYEFETGNKRRIKLKIKKDDIIVSGSTGLSSYRIEEALWWSKELKCKNISAETWNKTNHKEISSIDDDKENDLIVNVFKKVPLKKFFTQLRYFYVMHLYADEPGKASEATFADWSIRDSEAQDFADENPLEFKTLNLIKIIKILNAVANDAFESTHIASIGLDFEVKK